MVPAESVLSDVLPTERLRPNGKPKPELRVRMRRIPDARNACNVVAVWAQSFGLIWVAVRIDNPFFWVATFFLMGRAFGLFAILSHEAAQVRSIDRVPRARGEREARVVGIPVLRCHAFGELSRSVRAQVGDDRGRAGSPSAPSPSSWARRGCARRHSPSNASRLVWP